MTETWIEDPYFRAGFRIPDSGKARGKLSYARLGDNLRTKKAMRQNRLYWVMSLGIGMCSQKCPVVYAQVGHVPMSRPGSASLPVQDNELILSGLSEALIIMLAAPVLGKVPLSTKLQTRPIIKANWLLFGEIYCDSKCIHSSFPWFPLNKFN